MDVFPDDECDDARRARRWRRRLAALRLDPRGRLLEREETKRECFRQPEKKKNSNSNVMVHFIQIIFLSRQKAGVRARLSRQEL